MENITAYQKDVKRKGRKTIDTWKRKRIEMSLRKK